VINKLKKLLAPTFHRNTSTARSKVGVGEMANHKSIIMVVELKEES